MARIRLNAYGISESVNLLNTEINTLHPMPRNNVCMKLSANVESSRFRGRVGDVIVNWGSGRPIPEAVIGQATLLNTVQAVNLAANKLHAFNTFRRAEVNAVENTTSAEEAQSWVDEGYHVFCRTELRGHSGEGIVVTSENRPEDLGAVEWTTELPDAPLYTKGIDGQHREYRIHVFRGQVLFIQQKRRVGGYRDNPSYSNVVRNHGNGWIYGHLNMTQPDDVVVNQAVAAVAALGLDFGAVDVLSRRGQAWVLEVNTAPGLSGDTNRNNYARAILAVFNNEPVVGIREVESALPEETEEFPEEAPLTFQEAVIGETVDESVLTPTDITGNRPSFVETMEEFEARVEAEARPQAVTGERIDTRSVLSRATSGDGEWTVMGTEPVAPTQEMIWDESVIPSAEGIDLTLVWHDVVSMPTIGDVIRLKADSPHYNSGRNNPDNTVTGTVLESTPQANDQHYCVRISWANGYTNNYRWADLETTRAPESSQESEAELTTETVTANGVILVPEHFYVLQLSEAQGNKRIVGEYCSVNHGFWDTGMELNRVADVTVIREVDVND